MGLKRNLSGAVAANTILANNAIAIANSAISGTPKGSYATLSALNTANPDHAFIYVTVNDGKWNYWNGTAFVAGGQYQAALSVVSAIGQSTADVMSQKAVTDNLYKRSFINVPWYISFDETFNAIEAGYRKLGLICCIIKDGIPLNYQFMGSSLTGSGWYLSTNWKKINGEDFIQPLLSDRYLSPNSSNIVNPFAGYSITKLLVLDAYTSFTFSILPARTDFAYCHVFDINFVFLGAMVNTGTVQTNFVLTKTAILALYPTGRLIKLGVQGSFTVTSTVTTENIVSGINAQCEIVDSKATTIAAKSGNVYVNYVTSLDATLDSIQSVDRKIGLICTVNQSGVLTNYQFFGTVLTGTGWSSFYNWKKVSYYEDNNATMGIDADISNFNFPATGAIMLEPAPFDGVITDIKLANTTNSVVQNIFKVYNLVSGAYVEAGTYTYSNDYTGVHIPYRISVNIPISKGQFLGIVGNFYWGYASGSKFYYPSSGLVYNGIFLQYYLQKKALGISPISTNTYKNRWEGKTIVLDGDSISSTDYTWYKQQMKEKTNAAAVFNNGQSGGKASGLCVSSRLQSKVFDYNPDLIIVMESGNHDGAVGSIGTFSSTSTNGLLGEPLVTELAINYDYVSGTEPSYIACIDLYQRKTLAKYRNIRVNANLTGSETEAEKEAKIDAVKKARLVFLTGLPQKRYDASSAFSLPANWERKRQAIIEVCKKNGIRYIDTMNFFATELDWSIEPYWNSPTNMVNNNGIYTMDGLHPNKYGYDYLTSEIAEDIKRI